MSADLLARLEANCTPEPNTGCWLWTGECTDKGYGRIGVGGKTARAHRMAWTLANGPIPSGLSVCHHCDNRICVNPEHLFLGTHADNVRDRERKGRSRGPVGERNSHAKLTEAAVHAIVARRAAGMPTKEIAAEFGVSATHVWSVVNGLKWKSLTAPGSSRSPAAVKEKP